jgi:diguanylate cyclase (GGDEF)-like protein
MDDPEYPALNHIRKLLRDVSVPPLEGGLAENPLLNEIHQELETIRELLKSFSKGDISPEITIPGIIPGFLKTLQFHLNDLKEKEKTLRELANGLRREVNVRNSVVEALQESESRFKYLAGHDPLTGALHRRSFMERAGVELETSLALKVPCGVVMMDLDHFKNFNDTWGHQAGDVALCHVVSVITSLLRKNDFLGRYGGEEFVFLFSNADEATGILIAERVREALENNPVNLENGAVVITASFGLAMADFEKNQDEKYIDALINNADSALYQAKREGRNRVICFKQCKQGE